MVVGAAAQRFGGPGTAGSAPVELQLRRSSRLTVEGARLIASAIARTVSPAWRRSAISTRSASERNRGEIALVVKGSRGGTNRTVPSLRRTVWPRRQLWLVARLMPTSRRAAAGVHPWASSFKNCWRLADCGRRPGPFFTRRDEDNTTSTDLACVASTAGNHPVATGLSFNRRQHSPRGGGGYRSAATGHPIGIASRIACRMRSYRAHRLGGGKYK